MELKIIVLKYTADMSSHEKTYLCDDAVYVALDSQSGGYPYRTDLLRAQQWKTIKAAAAYRDMFMPQEAFDVVEVTFTVNEMVIHAKD